MWTGLKVDSGISCDGRTVIMHVAFREGDELTYLATLEVSKKDYFPLLKAMHTVENMGPTHYTLFGFHSEEERDEIRSNAEFEYSGDGPKSGRLTKSRLKYYGRT